MTHVEEYGYGENLDVAKQHMPEQIMEKIHILRLRTNGGMATKDKRL